MTDAPDDLLDLAGAIADGAAIDWDSAEASATTPDDRARIRELQLVMSIGRLHAGLTISAPGPHEREDSAPPREWGPLTILQKIGGGTFGDVYRAREPRLDRDVALKLLRRKDTASSSSHVIEEARLMARIRHPNVTAIYGADRIDGRVGLWMEFVDGLTLEEELTRRGNFDAHDLRRVGADIGAALSAVHRAGLLHRDVKAHNVIRSADDRLLLTDFGTGRPLDERETGIGEQLAGSPLYLAPEVLSGAPATVASDLYSLGVLLFRLATHSFPVAAQSIDELREAHAAGRRTTLREARTDLPRDLVRAVDSALAVDPAARPATAEAFVAELAPVRSHLPAAVGWAATIVVALAAATWVLNGRGDGAPTIAADARVIWSGSSAGSTLAVSHDGALLAYVDDKTGNLAVRALSSQTNRQITASGSQTDRTLIDSAVFSPDDRYLAYTLVSQHGDALRCEVRVIDVAHPVDHPAIYRHDPDEYLWLSDWSRDGQTLAVAMNRQGQDAIGLLGLDGRIRSLAPTDWRGSKPFFSPDGRWVAFDSVRSDTSARRDIFVISTTGGESTRVVSGPGQDLLAGWSPIADALLFVSDRGGTFGLWSQRLTGGSPLGPPTLVEPDIRDSPIGVTTDDRVFYRVVLRDQTVVTAAINLTTGQLGEVSRVFTGLPNYRRPKWSADQRFLAAVSSTSLNGPTWPTERVLSLLRTDTGQAKILPLPFAQLWTYSWSPDGRTLLMRVRDFRGRLGIFKVDATTGESEPLFLNANDVAYSQPQWAARSNTQFYYVHGYETFGGTERDVLRERNLTTGADRQVLTAARLVTAEGAPAPAIRDWVVSPDGTYAAGLESADAHEAVWVVPLTGRTIRQIYRAHDITHNALVWTPDSRAVIVNAAVQINPVVRNLLVVPIDDSRAPTAVALGSLRLTSDAPAIRPDGRQIAFQTGDAPLHEVRAVRTRRQPN